MAGYAWMARYTLEFLNAFLQRDEHARDYLKKAPMENGVPTHTMVVEYRAARALPSAGHLRRAVRRTVT